jgi:antirestriction protein ArdC
LVVEIGAAMTCAVLQITGELRHASYAESWLKVLKADSKAILTAASLASKATDTFEASVSRRKRRKPLDYLRPRANAGRFFACETTRFFE